MSSRPQPPVSSRSSPPAPKTIKLRAHALLSLPYRLTHPPPPQPRASTWGITPHFRIPLDEILNRKHLPPLGLKDFEEWLWYIDRIPECLYFILWLREYKTRFTIWARQSKPSSPIRCSSSPHSPTYRSVSAPPPPNPALTRFYLRAKETFLTPIGPYSLPVPLDVLAPYYSTSDVPGARTADYTLGIPGQLSHPPCPEVFDELEERVRAMLSESLDRFVVATFHNVGMPRAYCGCAGGTVIGLTGSVPILLANFLTGGSRWWRFSALPGLWLGMTIVISAMYGVCMMIYVFGDLRQLRSFEFARLPDIDQPMPSSSVKREARRKTAFRLFAKRNSLNTAEAEVGGQRPLTGPPPPLMQQSPSGDSTPAPRPPLNDSRSGTSRPTPPKLCLESPPPVHHYTHIHTATHGRSHHAQMQSMSSASTSYSLKFQGTACVPPHRMSFGAEEDCTVSGSDYESDYDSDSDGDASCSEASHESGAHKEVATDAELTSNPQYARRQRRRRRREREPEIHISDAIYDEEPSPEGPAMGNSETRRSSVWGESSEEDVGMGATFIHPFHWDEADESMCIHDVESQAFCAVEGQRIDAFNFDGLPPRPSRARRSDSFGGSPPSPTIPTFASSVVMPHAQPVDLEKPSRGVRFASTVDNRDDNRPLGQREAPLGPVGRLLSTVQTRCGPRNVAMYLLGGQRGSNSTVAASESQSQSEKMPEIRSPPVTSLAHGPISPTSTLSPPSMVWPGSPLSEKTVGGQLPTPKTSKASSKTSWRMRVRRMLQVPAFASPLTPVLNPIVTRGQWEIVVRSALIALVASLVVIGALVAAPETRVV